MKSSIIITTLFSALFLTFTACQPEHISPELPQKGMAVESPAGTAEGVTEASDEATIDRNQPREFNAQILSSKTEMSDATATRLGQLQRNDIDPLDDHILPQNDMFKVYPTPATEYAYLEAAILDTDYEFTIIDEMENEVLFGVLKEGSRDNRIQIEVMDLAAGTYTVKIQAPDGNLFFNELIKVD